MSLELPRDLTTDGSGLVPVVVQDRRSGDVLMVAWANAEALAYVEDYLRQKRMYADLAMENDALRELIEKKL